MRSKKIKNRSDRISFTKLFIYIFFLFFGLMFLNMLINNLIYSRNQIKNYTNIVKDKSISTDFVYCELGSEWFKLTKKTCLRAQEQYLKEQQINSNDQMYNNAQTDSSEIFVDDQEWGTTIKLDEHISVSKFGADSQMATVNELNIAMNSYRQVRNLQNLSIDDRLCEIATRRSNDQLNNGALDNHAGFDSEFQAQDSFYQMGEVLFGGNQPVAATHIVEWGWDQSLTGHKEAISDPDWTNGCGGIAGYFAVFIFGRK